jgi:hypothetical protein
MDTTLAYYRIDTILVHERELTHRLEQARLLAERAQNERPQPVSTASLAIIPATSH